MDLKLTEEEKLIKDTAAQFVDKELIAREGDYFGSAPHATSFGHFGASGTITWADPEEDLAVVLLTNRAWASRWPGSSTPTSSRCTGCTATG